MNAFYFLILSFLLPLQQPAGKVVSSPDGSLKFNLSSAGDKLSFNIQMNGKPVINDSPLLMSVGGVNITEGARTGKIKKFREDDTYPVLGLHSTGRNICNCINVSFKHSETGIKYTLEIKVFNDAAAFRFIVPGDEAELRVPDESTVFRLTDGSTVWYHDLYMHYEGVHARKLIDTVPAGQWAAPPVTVKLPDGAGYASITEADLKAYAGMALQTASNNGLAVRLGHSHPASYPYVLRYTGEDVERLSRIAAIKGTITTPWRVILAGKDLNTLVNSDAITNLCPPPDRNLFPEGLKTEWIKPGRAVWRYLDGGGDNSLRNMKEFSGQAAELGFEYNILEGFWSKWPDDSIKALVDYSGRLGVGIIVWKHSKDLYDPATRMKFFQRLNKLGIAGIKIDFFDHEAKEVIDLYESIFRETAALKLLLILHGANKPTGLTRTYPNVLIYEGVKGMEASKLTDRATHETTIPFTRMLAGAADYSVCHFGARRQNTTWVHQVATAAVYSAPVITYAANPTNILNNPCREMIKSIPAVWDETIVLPPSDIGNIAVYAQRSGKTWFLSVINGVSPKTAEIPLSFLGAGTYNTLVIKDNPENPADAEITKGQSGKDDSINLTLVSGGGYMVRFTPE